MKRMGEWLKQVQDDRSSRFAIYISAGLDALILVGLLIVGSRILEANKAAYVLLLFIIVLRGVHLRRQIVDSVLRKSALEDLGASSRRLREVDALYKLVQGELMRSRDELDKSKKLISEIVLNYEQKSPREGIADVIALAEYSKKLAQDLKLDNDGSPNPYKHEEGHGETNARFRRAIGELRAAIVSRTVKLALRDQSALLSSMRENIAALENENKALRAFVPPSPEDLGIKLSAISVASEVTKSAPSLFEESDVRHDKDFFKHVRNSVASPYSEPLTWGDDPPLYALPSGAAPERAAFSTVSVFYGTNRGKDTSAENPLNVFTSSTTDTSFGICEVSVPATHEIGEMESPSIWKLEFSPNPEKHICLRAIKHLSKEGWLSMLQESMDSGVTKQAFIFIHGYNVSFEDAARRTAQIKVDLKFKGAGIFFSWASKASLEGYPADEATIERSTPAIKEFLQDVAEKTEADKIFVIAHSMGNRGATRALMALHLANPTLANKFSAIVLAAPDIDRDTFKDEIAPAIVSGYPSVTLYSCSKDMALVASKKIHQAPRAGESGPHLVLVPGLTSIDATNADTSLMGHSYFSSAPSVISDVYDIFHTNTPPDSRFWLDAAGKPPSQYWNFRLTKR